MSLESSALLLASVPGLFFFFNEVVNLIYFFRFFFFLFLLNHFYCYSITVVPIPPPLPSSAHPTPHSHRQFPHCCPCLWVIHTCSLSSPQVANTRPMGQIQPSTLFYPAKHLVSTWWQHRALTKLLRSSYIYTVLKLHSAI